MSAGKQDSHNAVPTEYVVWAWRSEWGRERRRRMRDSGCMLCQWESLARSYIYIYIEHGPSGGVENNRELFLPLRCSGELKVTWAEPWWLKVSLAQPILKAEPLPYLTELWDWATFHFAPHHLLSFFPEQIQKCYTRYTPEEKWRPKKLSLFRFYVVYLSFELESIEIPWTFYNVPLSAWAV